MKLGPETLHQITIFDWIRTRKDLEPYSFHIANERKASPFYGRLLKRMGVKSGVSDIFIGVTTEKYPGMWLELKAGKNKLTENQKTFMKNMASQGYFTATCYGFEEAKSTILSYLSGDV
jgi:hypothetical protein